MHEDDRRTGVGNHFRHAVVMIHRADIIDNFRSFRQGLACHGRLHRIDRQRDGDPSGKPPDDRNDPPQFLFHRNGIRSGAGGLAADIDHIRPFLDHPDSLFHGHFR